MVRWCQVSSCKTWTGKGDAAEGELVPAADLTFTIDTDPATGQETVTVTELKQARRQGEPAGPDSSLCLDLRPFPLQLSLPGHWCLV